MPANVWTAVDNSSWFGTSWVCDCGPYVGPNPPQPPVWAPDDLAELDFYIFTPDSADLETLTNVGSVVDTWLTSGHGHSSGTLDTVGTPRLFVTAYIAGFPTDPATMARPSKAPLALVPSACVRGGYGPFLKGAGWTDWIESPTAAIPAHARGANVGPQPWWENGTGGGAGAISVDSSDWAGAPGALPPATDAAVQIESDRQAIAAGSGYAIRSLFTGGASPLAAVGYEFVTQKDSGQFFDYHSRSTPFTGNQAGALGQLSARLDPGSGLIFPALLSTLTEGADYGPDPETGDEYQYQGTDPAVFLGWDAWSVVGLYDNVASGTPVAAPSPDLDVDLRVLPVSPGNTRYVLWGEGSTLTSQHFPGTDTPGARTVVFDTMGLPDPPVWVAFMPRQFDPSGPPVPYSDYPPPVLGLDGMIATAAFGIAGVQPAPLLARMKPPPFRYYFPGVLTFPPAPGSAVRLNQRGDGLGISRHPRLTASQTPHAPRVGGKNTYQ